MNNNIIHDYGDCPICMEKLEHNIAVTACFHKFHFKCISEWIETNLKKNIICKCPCCNLELHIVNIFKQKNFSKPKKNKIYNENINITRTSNTNMLVNETSFINNSEGIETIDVNSSNNPRNTNNRDNINRNRNIIRRNRNRNNECCIL